MNRVVILTWKESEKPVEVYKRVTDLVRRNYQEIGICIGALWNAMSKNGGVYENKKCRIEYKPLQDAN